MYADDMLLVCKANNIDSVTEKTQKALNSVLIRMV